MPRAASSGLCPGWCSVSDLADGGVRAGLDDITGRLGRGERTVRARAWSSSGCRRLPWDGGRIDYMGSRGIHRFPQVHIGQALAKWGEPMYSAQTDVLQQEPRTPDDAAGADSALACPEPPLSPVRNHRPRLSRATALGGRGGSRHRPAPHRPTRPVSASGQAPESPLLLADETVLRWCRCLVPPGSSPRPRTAAVRPPRLRTSRDQERLALTAPPDQIPTVHRPPSAETPKDRSPP